MVAKPGDSKVSPYGAEPNPPGGGGGGGDHGRKAGQGGEGSDGEDLSTVESQAAQNALANLQTGLCQINPTTRTGTDTDAPLRKSKHVIYESFFSMNSS